MGLGERTAAVDILWRNLLSLRKAPHASEFPGEAAAACSPFFDCSWAVVRLSVNEHHVIESGEPKVLFYKSDKCSPGVWILSAVVFLIGYLVMGRGNTSPQVLTVYGVTKVF